MKDYVVHMERNNERTYCGRLWGAGRQGPGKAISAYSIVTDSVGEMEDRAGSRCKRCWKVLEREQATKEQP